MRFRAPQGDPGTTWDEPRDTANTYRIASGRPRGRLVQPKSRPRTPKVGYYPTRFHKLTKSLFGTAKPMSHKLWI